MLFSDIAMAETAAERQRQYRARRDAERRENISAKGYRDREKEKK